MSNYFGGTIVRLNTAGEGSIFTDNSNVIYRPWGVAFDAFGFLYVNGSDGI